MQAAESVKVTPETYIRAETDNYFFKGSQLAGGVNKLFHFRNVTRLDKQTVIRMNRDTLYSFGVVDTSGGAAITMPEMPAAGKSVLEGAINFLRPDPCSEPLLQREAWR